MLSTIFLLLICLNFTFADNVIVTIPNGLLSGRVAKTASNKPYYSFQKIPYATPPIGPLRFHSPQPVRNWDGVLDATKIDIMCYQLNVTSPLESEDCLYLNVYTTQLPNNDDNNKLLPVMVWIHGGRWSSGSSLEEHFGPQYLLDENVIIVTLNYRLGVFGFLSTLDAVIPGNLGLKDQSLAIQWVYNNIEYFGGDRERIIIFGQSAGGGAASFQLLNRQLSGIIKGVLCESGVAIDIWNNKTASRQIAFWIGAQLNQTFTHSNNSMILREFLSTVPAQDLKRAAERVASTGVDGLWRIFGPVVEVDHKDAFITTKMYEDFRDGNFHKVPILLGFNSEEHLSRALADRAKYRSTLKMLDDMPELITPPDMRIDNLERSQKMGQTIRAIYTNRSFAGDLGAGIRFMSDNDYIRAIIRKAELVSKYTNVYFYRFNYAGKLGNVFGQVEGAGRVAHSEELNYLWYMTVPFNNTNLEKFPKADILTHKRLLKLWTNFAKNLNPTPEPIELLQNITWTTVNFDGKDGINYLDIDEDLKLRTNPRSESYPSWKVLYGSLGFDNFDTY